MVREIYEFIVRYSINQGCYVKMLNDKKINGTDL